MKFANFLGGSYESQAYTSDEESTVNWYPEKNPAGNTILLSVPGVEPIAVIFDGAGRGHYYNDGREFVVFGDKLVEVDEDGGRTLVDGNVGSDDTAITPVTITSNGDLGNELLVVSDEGGWYVDLTAATLTATAIANLAGKATMGGYLDGYGLCLDAKTSTLYISNLADMTTWDTGTDFAQRSLAPDPWLAMKVVGRYIWLFGEQTTEIWQDVGARFPFAPLSSNVVQYGIAAPYSAAKVGNDVCWLARDSSGRVSVMRAGGVNPQVISTPALEYQISTYSDVEDAVGDSYSWNGHVFYLLNFDTQGVTWCWDLTTGAWHQRGTWDTETARYEAWSPRFFSTAFGDVRSVDRMTSYTPIEAALGTSPGFVYRLSETFNVDVEGKEIRRLRRAPLLVKDDKRLFFPEFQVLMDVGETKARETLATVALTAQTASIGSAGSPTTLFTVGSEATSYVVEWDIKITTATTDYSLQPQLNWVAGGESIDSRMGIRVVSPGETSRVGSVSIRADAGTVVSYWTVYGSTDPGMTYSISILVYIPGVEDPQMMLRTSDDGGKTWSSEKWASAGKTGEYLTRVHWHRLGAGRRRVFEVVASDPLSWKLTDAFLEATEGQS